MNYDQASQQAQQQGQAAQQQLDKQSALTQQQYQQQYGTTQDIQKQQQDYLKSIQEGGAQAEAALNRQYQQLGINPQAIAGANRQLAQTQTALANAGQAAQQVGGGYGMTAGGQAQALANMQGNLSGVLNAQSNTAQALSAQMAQALANASLVEQSQLTSQEQKLKGYSDLFSSANQLLAVSSDTMNKVQTLAQQQGYVTAQQVQAYQSAKNQAAQAGAAAAAAQLSRQQAEAQRLTNIGLQQQATLSTQQFQSDQAKVQEAKKNIIETKLNPNNPNSPSSFAFRNTAGQPITAVQYSQIYGIPFSDLVQRMANSGDQNAIVARNYLGNNFQNVPLTAKGALTNLGVGSANYQGATPTTYSGRLASAYRGNRGL